MYNIFSAGEWNENKLSIRCSTIRVRALRTYP